MHQRHITHAPDDEKALQDSRTYALHREEQRAEDPAASLEKLAEEAKSADWPTHAPHASSDEPLTPAERHLQAILDKLNRTGRVAGIVQQRPDLIDLFIVRQEELDQLHDKDAGDGPPS